MKFEFATAGRILFGAGVAAEAGRCAASLGRRAFLVTGGRPERVRSVIDAVGRDALIAGQFSVSGEPTLADAQAAVAAAREAGADVIVGIGGGSVMDAAKAVAALLANPGDIFDHLEVIGRGRPLLHPAAPCVAIPTTAGTGSEVTRNAVLASPEHRLKVSLRSPSMLPRIALVDPALTLELPLTLTASTGCDALAQLVEPFVCSRAQPMTDGLCREGLPRVARSLRRACEQGADLDARTDMAIASLFGGLALANAGLGLVHGLAGPIGGRFAAPHGAVCGILLAPAMRANLAAARSSPSGAATVQRYTEVARLLTGDSAADAESGIDWVGRLVKDLGIPSLRSYGIAESDLAELAAAAMNTSSMRANPVALTAAEIAAVALAAFPA